MTKRIIDGVTYNTATSTLVARFQETDWHDAPVADHCLYLTRGGAFFLVREFDWDRDDRAWSRSEVTPMTRERAQAWIMKGETEVFADVFEDPPEAEAEKPEKPEATVYVRVPTSLRDQLAEAAEDSDQSVNAYALRCFERCLKGDERLLEALVRAWYEVSSIDTLPDAYSQEQMVEMASSARESIERAWKLLGYTENDLASKHGSMFSARELPDRPTYVEEKQEEPRVQRTPERVPMEDTLKLFARKPKG